MSRSHLTKEERQALIDKDLRGSKDNYFDTHSIGWCDRHCDLDEHTPDFPDPQGPDIRRLISDTERQRVLSADKFDRHYERWGIWPGKQLKF